MSTNCFKENLIKNVNIIKKENEKLLKSTESLKSQKPLKVEEYLVTSCTLHQQLLELIGDEHAIDELIYYLGKALNSGSIEINIFLKTIRGLAKDHYLKRALIKKIQSNIKK